MKFKKLTQKALERIANPIEGAFRVALSHLGFLYFIFIYLRGSLKLSFADFHKKLIEQLEGGDVFTAVLGFRGCAKSTIIEMWVLYRILIKKNRFAIIIGSTDNDSKLMVANIKKMIEDNPLLQRDFGIAIENSGKKGLGKEKWSEGAIVINGCLILARSKGQKVRGLKFNDSRPDLIIGDDIEDVESAKSDQQRQKLREWFYSEVIPGMAQGELAKDCRVVLIGNLVHRDCLIANLERNASDIVHVHRFPIRNEFGESTWKALYPNEEAIQAKKKLVLLSGKGLGEIIWAREYELKILDEDDIIIKESDISYYPKEWLQKVVKSSGAGVDLAISQKQTADFTAMVKGVKVVNDYGEERLLILPDVINKHLDFGETIGEAKLVYNQMQKPCKFFVEKVGYQQSAIEIMQKNGISVEGVRPGSDKTARLKAVSIYIKSGMVLFADKGCENLLIQLIGFGVEPHDDMVDALVYLIDGMLNGNGQVAFG